MRGKKHIALFYQFVLLQENFASACNFLNVSNTITYLCPETKASKTISMLGGLTNLWNVTGMRWFALGVDYEMSGKDLSESVILSSKILKVLGGKPPSGFAYELFLDEKGEKISKSKGN